MNKSRRHNKNSDKNAGDNNQSNRQDIKRDSTQQNDKRSDDSLRSCRDCGLNWRHGHFCKAAGKLCLKCGRNGHFARVCQFSLDKTSIKKDDINKMSFTKTSKSMKNKNINKNYTNENINNLNFMEKNNNNEENFKDKQDDHKSNIKDNLVTKEEANTLYNQKKFKLALAQYTRLIELCPNESNFNNRSACYMMMGEYEKALVDAKKAVEINPMYIKGHTRLIKCALSLGNFIDAETALKNLFDVDPKNSLINSEYKIMSDAKNHLDKSIEASIAKNYKKALSEINKCLEICNYCISFKIRKGEYLALLGKYKDAETIANDILTVDKTNIDAKYIRGLCIYQSDVDKALTYFREILRLVPDHAKVVELYKKAKKISDKKREGNDAFVKKNYLKAYSLYQDGLSVDPANLGMRAKLFYNMAQVSYKLKEIQRSIDECTKALVIDAKYVKALMRRGKCYMDLEEYENAVADLTRACQIDNGKDCRELLDEAKKYLQVSKKNYHKIIGVSKNASPDEIKRAYKEKALLHHPDRHSTKTQEEQKLHEIKFKEIAHAYRILTKNVESNEYCDDSDVYDMNVTSNIFRDMMFYIYGHYGYYNYYYGQHYYYY